MAPGHRCRPPRRRRRPTPSARSHSGSRRLGPRASSSSATVPACEPSLTQGSRPRPAVSALKNRVSWMAVSSSGNEPAPPGSRSARRTVPEVLPLLTHGSRPFVPSSATKTSRLPKARRLLGDEPSEPGRRSFTRHRPLRGAIAPPQLPIGISSSMEAPMAALKYTRPPIATMSPNSWNMPRRTGAFPPLVTSSETVPCGPRRR